MLKAWFSNNNLTKLSDEEYDAMVDDYRHAFNGSEEVLVSELISHCFFQECLTEEDRIASNKAKEMLCRLGIWRPEKAVDIVRKLMEVM